MVASLDEAQALRADGTNLFRNGDYRLALDRFSMALDCLPPSDDYRHQRSTLLTNRAITYNRLKLFAEAEHDASAAIHVNPSNVKAYYHRMISRKFLNDVPGFKNDFEKYSELKENNEDSPDPGYLTCIDAAISQALATSTDDHNLMLIATSWWKSFRAYYMGSACHPGAIDNWPLIERNDAADLDERDAMLNDSDSRSSKLEDDAFDAVPTLPARKLLAPFDDGFVLRAELHKDIDYVVVPDNVWKPLLAQFGGGPAIRRPLQITRHQPGAPVVDVQLRPISVTIQRIDNLPGASKRIVITCSLFTTVFDVIRAVCSICTATTSEIRGVQAVGDFYEVVPAKLRLCDLGVRDDFTLFIERRTTTGLWPCSRYVLKRQGEFDTCNACFDQIPPNATRIVCETCQQAKYCSMRCKQSHSCWHQKLDHTSEKGAARTHLPGACGLMNIGNSCYINAALQCLSGTHELTRVFLSNDYVQELNSDNPLGSKGRLVEAYADLLKEMWFSDAPYADPREFKRAVSCFASQFAGCQQQDAQEFLSFLLDGIHEDLNRIRQKPYIPAIESNGRSDDVVAQEQWTNYLARDQSVVNDCLLGQFKSELVCAANPTCPPSATFDPFMYVSLPLPEPVRIIPVIYFPVSGQVPTQLNVKVERLSVISLEAAILPLLAERFDFTPGNQLVVAYLATSRPLTFLAKTNDSIDISSSQELAVFEIRPRCIPISCIMRQIANPSGESTILFRGKPFAVDFSLDSCPRVTGQQIYQRMYQFLHRSLCHPDRKPSFKIEMYYNNERTFISNTDDPVDLRYYLRPVLVLRWKTDELLDEIDMSEYQRVERESKGFVPTPINPTLTIYDCFKAFTKTESLGVDDWTCSSCRQKGNASKRMSFWRLPDVLILHLKRFDSVRRHALFGEAANKISKEVQFPLKDLDLSPFVSMKESDPQVPRYELFGVINHFGASFFGHYTAFTKGLDGVWRHFDDDTVKVVQAEEICQSNAYLLFYRRQSE